MPYGNSFWEKLKTYRITTEFLRDIGSVDLLSHFTKVKCDS